MLHVERCFGATIKDVVYTGWGFPRRTEACYRGVNIVPDFSEARSSLWEPRTSPQNFLLESKSLKLPVVRFLEPVLSGKRKGTLNPI